MPTSPGDPPVPWIVSNPIYVGREAGGHGPCLNDHPGLPAGFAVQYDKRSSLRLDDSKPAPASLGALDGRVTAVGRQAAVAALRARRHHAAAGPFVAFVMPAGSAIGVHDRLMFTGQGGTVPMRLSVQLRQPGGEAGERWRRSVYLDSSPRTISVYFDELTGQWRHVEPFAGSGRTSMRFYSWLIR